MERLVREGDNIGSWNGKSNFYAPAVLFQKAEELRVLAFQKYQAGTKESLKEAFVMMLRFAKFHDMIKGTKGVDRNSPQYQKLRRDLLTVIGALEELKPRLVKLLGEVVDAPAAPEMAAPRDELANDMAAQLEKRWAQLQPAKRPDPPPPPPTTKQPSTGSAAGALTAGAAAAGAAGLAGAAAAAAYASAIMSARWIKWRRRLLVPKAPVSTRLAS